jgi:type VI protein secretion system component Hcp
LRKYGSYISMLLLAIISIAWLPNNVFHKHDSDTHLQHMVSGDHSHEHHCEMDSYVCQDVFTSDCEHASHLSAYHANCFVCEFVFTKHFDKSNGYLSNAFLEAEQLVFNPLLCTLRFYSISADSRGPPVVAYS